MCHFRMTVCRHYMLMKRLPYIPIDVRYATLY
uniref:Uncharacterized protein n=1 Tax=Anguilla anguilla TaxID=7936 RepID=A0A0E9UFC2_ANGAN